MLILASGSPRRRELLGYIRPDFAVVTLPTDESLPAGTPPREGVEALALRKARAVFAEHPEDIVIGADTVVALDGKVFGKPRDTAEAEFMLRTLAGREHIVFTGVAIVGTNIERVFSEEAVVRFAPLTDEDIAAYVATGEPMDKAGGYGIQGRGALLVEGIRGDFYNVMGLPVCRLARELAGLE